MQIIFTGSLWYRHTSLVPQPLWKAWEWDYIHWQAAFQIELSARCLQHLPIPLETSTMAGTHTQFTSCQCYDQLVNAIRCGAGLSKTVTCKHKTCMWSQTTVVSKYWHMNNAGKQSCELTDWHTMGPARQMAIYISSWKHNGGACMNRLCMNSWEHNLWHKRYRNCESGRSTTVIQHTMCSVGQIAAAVQTDENTPMTVEMVEALVGPIMIYNVHILLCGACSGSPQIQPKE